MQALIFGAIPVSIAHCLCLHLPQSPKTIEETRLFPPDHHALQIYEGIAPNRVERELKTRIS